MPSFNPDVFGAFLGGHALTRRRSRAHDLELVEECFEQ